MTSWLFSGTQRKQRKTSNHVCLVCLQAQGRLVSSSPAQIKCSFPELRAQPPSGDNGAFPYDREGPWPHSWALQTAMGYSRYGLRDWSKAEAWGVATTLSQNHYSIPEVTQSHALRKKPYILKAGSQQTFKMLFKSTNTFHITRPTVWILAIRCSAFSGQARHGNTGCKDKYL